MRSALETRVHDKERRVIPVLLPGAPDSRELRLPRFLSRLTWVDFRAGLNDENALYRLYCGIQGIEPGAGQPGTGGDGGGLSNARRKVLTFLLRFLRLRRIWMAAVGVLLAVILLLGLTGNLFIDVPFFCGRELSSAAGYINQAIKHRDAGRSTCAIQELQKGLELQPTPVEQSHMYYLLSSIHLNRRELLKALENADLGLSIEAGIEYEYLLYAARGFAYCQMGQNSDAAREFNIFLNSQPERAGSLVDVVNALLADFATGKDMRDVCWVRGAESLP
jgi:tetratricopeptide (TPR) repeat protein